MILRIPPDSPRTIIIPNNGLTNDQFVSFCHQNPDWHMERAPSGSILVRTPSLEDAGCRNAEVAAQLGNWSKADGTGKALASCMGYHLPNGATRCPDASWISLDSLKKARKDRTSGFLPACPEFVVEVRSRTDSLRDLQEKMHEYAECGAQLGWLIDPYSTKIYVYRPAHRTKTLDSPSSVSADPVLPGFTLDLTDIWDIGF